MCMIMLKSKNKDNKNKKQCYISVPSQIITPSSLQSLLLSPKKAPKSSSFKIFRNPRFYFSLIFLFGFLGMLKMWYNIDPFVPFTPNPCSSNPQLESSILSNGVLSFQPESSVVSNGVLKSKLKSDGVEENMEKSDEKIEFWKQPDGLGYRPCLDFSRQYEKDSVGIMKDRSKYLVVVVSGGMNQQRNQIVDAVVIARILGAALVVPILQVNVIWGDERFVFFFNNLTYFCYLAIDLCNYVLYCCCLC